MIFMSFPNILALYRMHFPELSNLLHLHAKKIACPYCGETFAINIDCSVEEQYYIEDCWVCCRPIQLEVTVDATGEANVVARHEDDC